MKNQNQQVESNQRKQKQIDLPLKYIKKQLLRPDQKIYHDDDSNGIQNQDNYSQASQFSNQNENSQQLNDSTLKELDQQVDFTISSYLNQHVQYSYKNKIRNQFNDILTNLSIQTELNTSNYNKNFDLINLIGYLNKVYVRDQQQMNDLKQNLTRSKIQNKSILSINEELLLKYKQVFKEFDQHKQNSLQVIHNMQTQNEILSQKVKQKNQKIFQLENINYELELKINQLESKSHQKDVEMNKICLNINQMIISIDFVQIQQKIQSKFLELQTKFQQNTIKINENIKKFFNYVNLAYQNVQNVINLKDEAFQLIKTMSNLELQDQTQCHFISQQIANDIFLEQTNTKMIDSVFIKIKQQIKQSIIVNKRTSKKLLLKQKEIRQLESKVKYLMDKIQQISLSHKQQQKIQNVKYQKKNDGSPIQMLKESLTNCQKVNQVNEFKSEMKIDEQKQQSQKNQVVLDQNNYKQLIQQNIRLKQQITKLKQQTQAIQLKSGKIKRSTNNNQTQKHEVQTLEQQNNINQQNVQRVIQYNSKQNQKQNFKNNSKNTQKQQQNQYLMSKYKQNIINLNEIINYMMNILKGYYNPFFYTNKQIKYNNHHNQQAKGHLREYSYLHSQLLNDQQLNNYLKQMNSTLILNSKQNQTKKIGQISNILTKHDIKPNQQNVFMTKHLSREILKQKYENFQFIRKLCLNQKNCKQLISKFNQYVQYYFDKIKQNHRSVNIITDSKISSCFSSKVFDSIR